MITIDAYMRYSEYKRPKSVSVFERKFEAEKETNIRIGKVYI